MNPPIFFTLLKHFAIFLPFVFFGKTGLCEPESIESKSWNPQFLMKHEAKWLVQALEQAHFNKVPIDKLEPREFISSFLERLDKQKLYFTQKQVDKYHKSFSATLITFFKQGNLFPAFEIYNDYKSDR